MYKFTPETMASSEDYGTFRWHILRFGLCRLTWRQTAGTGALKMVGHYCEYWSLVTITANTANITLPPVAAQIDKVWYCDIHLL